MAEGGHVARPDQSVFLDRLRDRLGPAGVLVDEADMAGHLVGPTRRKGTALCVARPASTEETQAVVQLAQVYGLKLVPQGGNTGLSDGALPLDAETVVLNLGRMNRIRDIDRRSYALTLEAGVILASAQVAAAEADLLLPFSIGSEGSCQIGGILATNAGGKSALRYGTAADLVLGLEVVLPDGRLWDGLRSVRKDNTGLDMKRLFLGSEGRLGVITAAVLGLRPAMREAVTAFVALNDPDRALSLLDRLRRATGDSISAFELMNAYTLDVAVRHLGGTYPFGEPTPWSVLVEVATSRGDGTLENLVTDALADAAEAGEITDASVARNQQQATAFWRLRDDGATLFWKEGAFLLHDPSVPLSKVPAFIEQVIEGAERLQPGTRIAAFGHVGDGNIHIIASQPIGMDKKAFVALRKAMQDVVYGAAYALGGSFSAEHGIGETKIDTLERYRSPVQLDLMSRVKKALDPDALLNPAKVLRSPG